MKFIDDWERQVKNSTVCPRCHAPQGQHCRNLTKPNRKASHVHAARVSVWTPQGTS